MKSCKNAPISFTIPVHLLPIYNNLGTSEQIFMKFYVGKFTEISQHIPVLVIIRQEERTLIQMSACITAHFLSVNW